MKKLTTFLLGFLVCLNIASACINDSNSKLFEMQPFPTENQLIDGSFHVYSKAFHEWRIKDRLDNLKQDPDNAALLDDLSVSYEKTGQTQLAIDTLQSVLNKYPNRYETLANLGTFYIHHSEYQKGVDLLKKAIVINPQAHYGREIYQIKVVEYILSLNKKAPFVFPVQSQANFADFLLNNVPKDKQKDEIIRAIVGVSGMLKFGNSDSPILLEVLGDLYDRLSNDYIDNYFLNYQTNFTSIARNFYISSFIKSNLSDKKVLLNFLSNKKQFDSFEYINAYGSSNNIEENLNLDIKEIKDNIEKAKVDKQEKNKKEYEVLQTSTNPEKDVQALFSAPPKIQPDLFLIKQTKINILINLANLEYKKTVITMISSYLFPLLIMITLLFIGILLNVTYFKNKKYAKDNEKVEYLLSRIKSYLILWDLTVITILSFFINLLSYVLSIYKNETIFLFIIPLFLFSLICIFTIRQIKYSKDEFDEDMPSIMKPIISSKKTLYFLSYGLITFIIVGGILSSIMESKKTSLLDDLHENISFDKDHN